MVLIKNVVDLFLIECGFLSTDIKHLHNSIKKIFVEQKEGHLDCLKNGEESIIEKVLEE